jgi:transposase-like protein
MGKRSYTPEQRTQALELYRTDGPRAAAATTGIPPGTISAWATRAGLQTDCVENAAVRVQAAQLKWEERRLDLANGIGELAAVARDRALEEARNGKPRDAQALATTMAIAVDKAQLLTGAATSRHEHVDSIDAAVERLEHELSLEPAQHGP